MVALASPVCPSSFQLRWGLRCRRSPAVQFRIRFGSFDRKRRVGLVRAEAGSEEERRSRPEDSFSGWFGEDSSGGDSNGKKDYGGIIGAGLAGIFLAAGVTFASLSLSSKRSTGLKQQMEPLTTQQEVLLSSNDQNEKDDAIEEKSIVALPGDGVEGPESGTKEEHDTAAPTAESAYENVLDNNVPELFSSVHQTETADDSVNGSLSSSVQQTEIADDAVNASPSEHTFGSSNAASPEDLHSHMESVKLLNNDIEDPKSGLLPDHDSYLSSLPSGSNQSSNEILEFDSANASSPEDLHSNMESGKTDSTAALHNNATATNLANAPSCSTDNFANVEAVQQEENSIPSETEKPETAGEVTSQTPSETLVTSNYLDSKSNVTLDVKAGSNDLAEMVEYFSNEHSVEPSENLQPVNETSTLLQLGHSIEEKVSVSDVDQKEDLVVLKGTLDQNSANESGLSAAPSLSELLNQYSNESDGCQAVERYTGRLLSESLLPDKSFSNAGIPAPSVVSSVLQVPLGRVLVPAVVDQVQGQAFTALQVLKVIENDVQPGDICTRREYARWLVSASSTLSRNTTSKVYPAMYIENVTELAFDDITPEDPDFSCIQGLAEAGLISSKLSRADMNDLKGEELGKMLFIPESPLSRQYLVSWKMALVKRQLPEVDKKIFHQSTGYIDINKIKRDAWPAIVADLSSGENGIISLAFGYTRLFQPEKPVTKAQAAVALSTGDAAEVVAEELARIEAESLAETAVAAHTALVAEVEKDLNARFEKELAIEREKVEAIGRLAEEARAELDKLRMERDEENTSLIRGRAAVESEMEVLTRLRNEVEEQLQSLISNKIEIAFERDRVNKLHIAAESENQAIVQLQNELEVERKALAMARAWAEDEATRAREQAKVLEEARERWERHGIKVIVDEELRESASNGVTFIDAGKQAAIEEARGSPENFVERLNSRSKYLIEEMKVRAESLVEKLKALAVEVRGKSAFVIKRIIENIEVFISALKQQAAAASKKFVEHRDVVVTKANESMQEFKSGASEFGSGVRDGAKRTIEDCKENMEKITQKFKI